MIDDQVSPVLSVSFRMHTVSDATQSHIVHFCTQKELQKVIQFQCDASQLRAIETFILCSVFFIKVQS